jgi:Tfp pilus assembly protein PilF
MTLHISPDRRESGVERRGETISMRILPMTCSLLLALLLGLVAGCSGNKSGSTVDSQLSFGSKMAERGLWSEAYFRFEQATRTDPQDPKAWNNLAVASEALGEFEEALGHYRKGLELDPESRTLRRNYDRFSGFYSAFKAAQERDRQRREEVETDPADREAEPAPDDDAGTEADS